MFIPKNFALSVELAEAGSIKLSNFSNHLNKLKNLMDDYSASEICKKTGECALLNMTHSATPKAFKDIYYNSDYNFTDFSDCVYSTEFLQETGVEFTKVKKALNLKSSEFTVLDKTFIRFIESEDIFFKKHIFTTVSRVEAEDLQKNSLITGYIKISNKKYLTWY